MTERVKTEASDPKRLGKSLQTDLEKLVRGCTMTGKTHDELHRFLVQYIPAITKLSESGTDESVEHVKSLLTAYPKYFE